MKYRPLGEIAPKASPMSSPRPLWRTLTLYSLGFLVIFGVAIFVGSAAWTPTQIWSAVCHGDDPEALAQWLDFRVWRALYAASVGAALALAGVAFQAVLRNPLAEPYILGVSGGAALGAMTGSWLLPWFGVASLSAVVSGDGYGDAIVSLLSFGGAALAVLLLLAISAVGRLHNPSTLILAGVILNAVFGALILLIFSLAPEQQIVMGLMRLMGNIGGETVIGTPHLKHNLLVLVVATTLLMSAARHLDLLALSDDEALDLGLAVRRFRVVTLLVASLLTGVVVASAGPIGFVGLIVPHIARRLHGAEHRRLIPIALIAGGAFLVAADALSRSIHAAQPLPVGVITALAGGPFFLALLVLQAREGDTIDE
ncbi:MAG: FecCD family ABC transporter permease [Planctomycetota bacterium]